MTQTKTRAPVVACTDTGIQAIERISFDLGNRFNAITDGKTLLNWPSYCASLSSRQDLDYSAADFKAGQSYRVDIGAGAYKVGAIAGQLGSKPTFGGDKWLKAQPFLFAGLAGLGIEPQAHIKELRCTVPDDQDVAQCTPFKRLAGQIWEFKVNGQPYAVRIDQVKIAAEAKFAWYCAIKDGLYQYPSYLNAVLDLGGGTAIARLFTPNGTIARDYELVIDGGTSALAVQIAGEVGLLGCEGQILDAIADGSFAVHAVNIKAAYDALLPQWVDSIRSDINTRWKSIQNQYAQILMVGGSAPLFAPFVAKNPRYIVAPNPQFYALEGMQNA
ncbi:MAG: hypothetical protein WBG32_00890 [Nodosilinea sp.]